MYGWAAVGAVVLVHNTWAGLTGRPMMSEDFHAWYDAHPVQATLLLLFVSAHLTKRPRRLSRFDPLTAAFGVFGGR